MKKSANPRPKQKALTLAVAAALAAIAPAAEAVDTIVTMPVGSTAWSSGNFTVTNTGAVSGTTNGIHASGSVGTLTNSGAISATTGYGIINFGSITALTNNSGGTIRGGGASGTGIFNSFATIGTLTNSGTISGGNGIFNGSDTIGSLTNSGTISGTAGSGAGIVNAGGSSGGHLVGSTIGTLTNSGLITGSQYGINNNGGVITTLNNAGGTISGGTIGIANSIITFGSSIQIAGTIGTLTNSGLITGSTFALFNDASSNLGPITNAGTIAGNIENDASQDLTINGGSGSAFGTLTGFGGTIGTITNTNANVVFGSGNLLLNDTINVGSHTVTNTAAALQVNNPVAITGSYSQGAAATLLIGVANGAVATGSLAGDSGYGRLVVSGSAVMAAGTSVSLQKLNSYAFATGQRFVVVDAASSGTNYNENSLKYSAGGYGGTIVGQAVNANGRSDLMLCLGGCLSGTTTSSAIPATVPNAVASLAGLTRYTGTDPALLNVYNAAMALQSGTSEQANRVGVQLSPVQPATAARAAATPTTDVLNLVAARADSLRLARAEGGSGIATGEGALNWGVWGQGFGGHTSQGARDAVDGYSANYGGLLLGADRSISDDWRVGGVFSYSNTLIKNTGNSAGDSTRVNAYGLIGYASYIGQAWYTNLSAGVVQQQYDTTRVIDFTGVSGTANGRFGGQQYVARAEAGYPLALGGVTLTPLGSLTYSYQYQNAYTETGGSGAALSVGATHTTSVRSDFGVKIERGFASSYGTIVPDLRLVWRHEYDHTKQLTGASFAADPTGQTGFTTVGASPVSDMAVISAGVTLLRANNLTLSARYEVQAAPHYVSQTGALRLRQVF